MIDFNIFLFDDFETLDVFGPVEVIGRLNDIYNMKFFSQRGGIITSRQKTQIVTVPYMDIDFKGVLFVPGGQGTRIIVNNQEIIAMLKNIGEQSINCITVCTGAALLAKTGLVNGIKATSNKRAFEWVKSLNNEVSWIYKARWVADGKYYTSAGVSAGIDMILGFVCDKYGRKRAEEIAKSIEYIWNHDPDKDIFAL